MIEDGKASYALMYTTGVACLQLPTRRKRNDYTRVGILLAMRCIQYNKYCVDK